MEQSLNELLTLTGKLKPEEEKLLEKAYLFAQKAHAGQKRLSGEPYFSHVLETAKILASLGMDIQTIVAGLLHDVLEDTKTTEEELTEAFGKDIVFLVEGVTKLGTLKYYGYERHVESLRKFFIAMTNDLRVVIIKFADRLHNLKTLQYIREDKRHRIALESIDVYAPLANRLGMGKLKGELEDAAFPYAYPKEYLKTEEIIQASRESYRSNLEKVREELEKKLIEEKIKNFELSYRVKHKYSLYKKLLKYDMDIGKIYDIVALRVIVENLEDCYRVLGIVHSIWNPLQGRIKDYIAVPKPNGYRSVHTTVFTGSGEIAEIQIRTEEMHREAEYGIAAHFIYKEQKNTKKILQKDKLKFNWIEELKELNYNTTEPDKFIEHLKADFFSNRIFIFTPKGDVVDLPEDSIPIDFAYTIHSDIGDHTFGVKINGKMSQLFTKLKNGDIVEIVTNKDAHPSSKWLDMVKTTVAKKHIKSYLEKNSLLAKLKSFGRN
ncbi:hypothetical protein COU49_02840 [Candidatus Nomurabacteria bacterium CG10_big_fil_rev_8_21_14_0_10_35_16]|uniref:TGS domain-containing protein n=1 Tax=Candidatus Nomurabacteria bacterium CG10_big_fil_rev_8_21_14_0_10_35_16 TaxID=1974731 RepID=A0A2H0TAP6_9BACT|nr:MAG: hypothetical protein COU49_02840 [Candidatus Nomurabacteria bacterium CG10_big_fil_rev_8_21_14_0_10_35_16]